MSDKKSGSPSSLVIDSNDPNTLVTIIRKLASELAKSHEETRKAEDQIACLVSLIKRSWHGDKTATTHLANIIGLSRMNVQNESNGYIHLQKSRAIQNWERLCLKTLDKEYARVEQEIKMKQNLYFRHRELYMEEILNSHEEEMSTTPLRRKLSATSLEDADNQFLQQRAKSATGSRASSANRLRQRRQLPKGPRDVVKQVEVHVADLFLRNSQSDTNTNVNKGITSLYQFSKDNQGQRSDSSQSGISYDDPKRYNQPQLFDIRQAIQQPVQRKARPVSAAIQRERGRLQTRPKSAVIQSHTTDRAVKHETSKPWVKTVKTKPPVPRLDLEETKQRHGTATGTSVDNVTFVRNPSVSCMQCNTQAHPSDTDRTSVEPQKPSITVKIRSAVKRPEFIDAFAEDEQKMNDMEDEFRKTALQLQKKLGIEDSGLIH